MDATATLNHVTSFDGRIPSPVIARFLLLAAIPMGAAWMINAVNTSHPPIHAGAAMELATFALAKSDPIPPGAADLTFESRWTGAMVSAQASAGAAQRPVDSASNAPPPPSETGQAPDLDQAADRGPPPAPPSEKSAPARQAQNKSLPLPEFGGRTAVYDIAARTVYLPNGDKLEAHSGLGGKLDNPRYVNVKMRGPTPPNVYQLTLREQPFHGVRAIRLNPVDGGRMFGRDGMLAHTYMLGPNGQSNGCVSFRNYPKFLAAFLRGEFDRLVVVPDLRNAPSRTALSRLQPIDRYAFNDR